MLSFFHAHSFVTHSALMTESIAYTYAVSETCT